MSIHKIQMLCMPIYFLFPFLFSSFRIAISVKSAAVIAGTTVLCPLVCLLCFRYEPVLTDHFIDHRQQEHDTRHGSMEQTTWFLEEEKEGIEVGGHKYGSGESGAPMLCSSVCKSMGRYVHIEHIATTRRNGIKAMDWVTHNLYWRKSGS